MDALLESTLKVKTKPSHFFNGEAFFFLEELCGSCGKKLADRSEASFSRYIIAT
jgi:hypothetical protein